MTRDEEKAENEVARKRRAEAAARAEAYASKQREQLEALMEENEKAIEQERETTKAVIAEERARRDRRVRELQNGN